MYWFVACQRFFSGPHHPLNLLTTFSDIFFDFDIHTAIALQARTRPARWRCVSLSQLPLAFPPTHLLRSLLRLRITGGPTCTSRTRICWNTAANSGSNPHSPAPHCSVTRRWPRRPGRSRGWRQPPHPCASYVKPPWVCFFETQKTELRRFLLEAWTFPPPPPKKKAFFGGFSMKKPPLNVFFFRDPAFFCFIAGQVRCTQNELLMVLCRNGSC